MVKIHFASGFPLGFLKARVREPAWLGTRLRAAREPTAKHRGTALG